MVGEGRAGVLCGRGRRATARPRSRTGVTGGWGGGKAGASGGRTQVTGVGGFRAAAGQACSVEIVSWRRSGVTSTEGRQQGPPAASRPGQGPWRRRARQRAAPRRARKKALRVDTPARSGAARGNNKGECFLDRASWGAVRGPCRRLPHRADLPSRGSWQRRRAARAGRPLAPHPDNSVSV